MVQVNTAYSTIAQRISYHGIKKVCVPWNHVVTSGTSAAFENTQKLWPWKYYHDIIIKLKSDRGWNEHYIIFREGAGHGPKGNHSRTHSFQNLDTEMNRTDDTIKRVFRRLGLPQFQPHDKRSYDESAQSRRCRILQITNLMIFFNSGWEVPLTWITILTCSSNQSRPFVSILAPKHMEKNTKSCNTHKRTATLHGQFQTAIFLRRLQGIETSDIFRNSDAACAWAPV